MRDRCALLCVLLLGGAWAVACGSDGDPPAAGGGGDNAGGAVTDSGAATGAGNSAGGVIAAGAPSQAAAGAPEAGADTRGGPSGGAGGAPSTDYGQLLFDSPGAAAIARGDLFLTVNGLVWSYELDGKSFIASGPASGGELVDLVESEEPISVFNVGSTIAYQAGAKLFSHPRSATALTPVELDGAPTCVALASAAGNVYCRSTAGTIVRWAESGGAGTVLATGVPPGPDLVADALPVNPASRRLYFCEEQGAVSSIPLTGFGGGAISPPLYVQINKQEASPRGLHVGVPGDDVLYWINVPDAAPARVRGSAKTTPPVTSAGPPLASTRVFTPYSWNAGAIIAIEQPDESAQIAFVRFAQSLITPHFESLDGVAALTAEKGRYYWLDRSARVFTGEAR